MKTETLVAGAVIGGIALVALVTNAKASPAVPHPEGKGKDYPGPWAPGIYQSKIKVGDRLIVNLPDPGAGRAFYVDFMRYVQAHPGLTGDLSLTSSKISGPKQVILTGHAAGLAGVSIYLIDSGAMILKPVILNGVIQEMVIGVEVTL